MCREFIFSLIFWCFLLAPHPSNAEVVTWKTVGQWDVSFFPGGPGCAVSTLFDGGTYFFFGFSRMERTLLLDLTLMNENWKSIEDGKEYSIKVYFGDETPWTLDMDGIDFDGTPGLSILLDASSEEAELLSEEFQRETNMDWYFNNNRMANLTLRGSRTAFQETIKCQKSFDRAFFSVSDPFSSQPPENSDDPFAD